MNIIRSFLEDYREKRRRKTVERICELSNKNMVLAILNCKDEAIISDVINKNHIYDVDFLKIDDKYRIVDIVMRYYKSGKEISSTEHIYAVMERLWFNDLAIDCIYEIWLESEDNDSVSLKLLQILCRDPEIYTFRADVFTSRIKNKERLQMIADDSSEDKLVRAVILSAIGREEEALTMVKEVFKHRNDYHVKKIFQHICGKTGHDWNGCECKRCFEDRHCWSERTRTTYTTSTDSNIPDWHPNYGCNELEVIEETETYYYCIECGEEKR